MLIDYNNNLAETKYASKHTDSLLNKSCLEYTGKNATITIGDRKHSKDMAEIKKDKYNKYTIDYSKADQTYLSVKSKFSSTGESTTDHAKNASIL